MVGLEKGVEPEVTNDDNKKDNQKIEIIIIEFKEKKIEFKIKKKKIRIKQVLYDNSIKKYYTFLCNIVLKFLI